MKIRRKCGRRNFTRRRAWNVKIRDDVPPPWRQRMRGRWLSSVSVLMIETVFLWGGWVDYINRSIVRICIYICIYIGPVDLIKVT